jgi:CBS domain-containing protein
MNAKDIMTTPVITVTPDTAVHDVAELLLERRISGVPVVADGEIVGMVNEGDLLQRHEIGTDGNSSSKRSWWARLTDQDDFPIQYVKAHGRKAKDVMSRHVVPVAEDTPARQLASIFVARHIRRLPVLRGRQLVGIVARADLIRALARTTQGTKTAHSQSDEAIRTRLLQELEQQRWWRPDWSAVYVQDGVVHYHGLIRSDGEREAARVAAENVPGVRGVEDERITGVGWQPML